MAKDVRTIITEIDELYYSIRYAGELINVAMGNIGEGNDKGALKVMSDSKNQLNIALKNLDKLGRELQQIVL